MTYESDKSDKSDESDEPYGRFSKEYACQMNRLEDTIVAPITGVQPAAVAVLRLSGPKSWLIASRVFSPWPDPVQPRYAVHGHYGHGDDGLALPFAKGHSYTGEESVELSVHGSYASVVALESMCIEAGARRADPGEFTLRAFMNGRIDLTQAEGVRDTVEARTDAQLRQGNLMREGALRTSVGTIRDRLVGVLTAVEASTDFSEEIGDLDRTSAVANVEGAELEAQRLLSTLGVAKVIREGTTVAIVGRPNVGKSSLLNAVAKADRVIVTDVPGTTRDTVTEVVAVNGLLVRFVDTAGLRATNDVVEKLGVERTRDLSTNADHVWFVYDLAVGWTDEDERELLELSRPVTIVANKSDLLAAPSAVPSAVSVSAKSGEGLSELLASLSASLDQAETPLVNQRHAPLLREALESLAEAHHALTHPVPDDLAAVGLRAAVRALGEITGETAPPDIIERVFHDFCIGK